MSFFTPYIEKYRPVVLEDIVGNDDIMDRLRALSVSGCIPNLLFSGTAGIGKTTTILCLARLILKDHFKNAVKELNASDERGLDVVRSTIKGFAQTSMNLPKGMYKIIILDEVDSMTESAQMALRRIMEDYSSTTRFCLACNDISKIIEPIQSRTALITLRGITNEGVLKRLREVCCMEGIIYTDDVMNPIHRKRCEELVEEVEKKYTYLPYNPEECVVENEGLNEIAKIANGDMRSALNLLQAVVMSTTQECTVDYNELIDNENDPEKKKEEKGREIIQRRCVINRDNVFKVADIPKPEIIRAGMRQVEDKNFCRGWEIFKDLIKQGYSVNDIFNGMYREVIDKKIDERRKVEILRILAEGHANLVGIVDSELQLARTLSLIGDI